jgi:ABC-2 type transport system ATP-binding protein
VLEILRFPARLHRMARADARRRIPAVLERVGLAGRERSLIGQLSRGLRQRVGLALALLPEPEVLILDEPTSGLDPLQRIEVRSLVRELAAEHTVLLSSHILPEVEAVCPRVLVLHKGRLAADGTHEELVRRLAPPAAVRVEARVPDPAAALAALAALPGVRAVRASEGSEGACAFELEGEGDPRPAIGELARARGWTLRELSRHRPTLEEIFARIALESAPPAAAERLERAS